MLFSDSERQKGLPYRPSGRERNKYLPSIIIVKGLAVADLLDLGEKVLWSGEKVDFFWFPRCFSVLMPYPSKSTRRACPVPGGHSGSLATWCGPSPKRAHCWDPGLQTCGRSARTLLTDLLSLACCKPVSSQTEPKPQAQALISFTLEMAVD